MPKLEQEVFVSFVHFEKRLLNGNSQTFSERFTLSKDDRLIQIPIRYYRYRKCAFFV